MNAARRTLAPRLILAAAILAGCRMPTEPTPSAVREAMQPDTARIVTEVDALPRSFRAPVNGQCDSGLMIAMVRAVWVRGETVVSDTFRVAKCVEGI